RPEAPSPVTPKRLALLCLVTLCYLAGPAAASGPRVLARAWLVENAATGEVLAAHDAHARVPIASITKLMTVLVVLEHHELTDVARDLMRIRFVRETVAERTDTIAGGRTLHTWNDLLGVFPHVLGVKTGHTAAAGWSQVAAVRGRGVTIYATILGGASRAQRN